eukprot:6205235-Pleurochrysis_carterae.AAC.1
MPAPKLESIQRKREIAATKTCFERTVGTSPRSLASRERHSGGEESFARRSCSGPRRPTRLLSSSATECRTRPSAPHRHHPPPSASAHAPTSRSVAPVSERKSSESCVPKSAPAKKGAIGMPAIDKARRRRGSE